MNNQEKWDRRFLELAKLVSTWSKDPSTKVGVVLVKDRKIVATGYNGFPAGIKDDERLNEREQKYPLVVHAEMNAILQAGRDAKDSTLYMHGFPGPPCQNCAKHVITAGIKRIVHWTGKIKREEWQIELDIARETLLEAKIIVDAIERN